MLALKYDLKLASMNKNYSVCVSMFTVYCNENLGLKIPGSYENNDKTLTVSNF